MLPPGRMSGKAAEIQKTGRRLRNTKRNQLPGNNKYTITAEDRVNGSLGKSEMTSKLFILLCLTVTRRLSKETNVF